MEAQLLSQQVNVLFGLPSQSHERVEEEESAAEPPFETATSRHRKLKRQPKIPDYSTLSLTDQAMIGSRRSRFSLARKQEVAKVRRLGSCLRCRSMKIAVSTLNFPCLPKR